MTHHTITNLQTAATAAKIVKKEAPTDTPELGAGALVSEGEPAEGVVGLPDGEVAEPLETSTWSFWPALQWPVMVHM